MKLLHRSNTRAASLQMLLSGHRRGNAESGGDGRKTHSEVFEVIFNA